MRFSSASTRFSRLSRSASISSVSIVSMSAIGSIVLATCVSRIVEAAHHMRDGVDLADVAEELVAEPLAFRGALHQPRDIHEGEPRRHDLGRFGELRQHLEPRVGHRDLADVRLDGAERIVGGLRRRRLGERIEQRRLADIRQPDDAAFETHLVLSLLFCVVLVVFGRAEALRGHREMHLVLEARVLALRDELGVGGDDIAQRLDPGAVGFEKSLSTWPCTNSLPGWPTPNRTRL